MIGLQQPQWLWPPSTQNRKERSPARLIRQGFAEILSYFFTGQQQEGI